MTSTEEIRPSIRGFTGEYYFLSNFYNSPFTLGSETARTVEHAFQATKAKTVTEWLWVLNSQHAGQAKRRGRLIAMRDDWDSIKLEVMEVLVTQKFLSNVSLAKRLINTGDSLLVEENNWGDTFWGTVNNVGQNHLGLILMRVRRNIKDLFYVFREL